MCNIYLSISYKTVLAYLILLACFLPNGCTKNTDDEEEINKLIDTAIISVENGKTGNLMALISDDFQGSGVNSRREFKALLLFYFRSHQEINIMLLNRQITIDQTAAVVDLSALLTGHGRRGAIIPEQGEHVNIKLELQKNGQWEVVAAYWQEER